MERRRAQPDRRSDRAVDLGDSALLLAKMNLAGADAAINCWNDKYYWDFWRPWQAIHEANRDHNPATRPDPSWTALITAPYPEHPSGHLCLDGAHLRVLRRFFGTDQVPFGVTSSRFPGETRLFDRFSSLSTRSSAPGSGRACITGRPTSKPGSSEGTSSGTWRSTTSNPSTDLSREAEPGEAVA